MIDTIKLKIPGLVFEIQSFREFKTTESAFHGAVDSFRIWEHRSTYLKNKATYLPIVKLFKNGGDHYLTVKFSAPKMLFGENVSELDKGDFRKLLRELKATLFRMGIKINLKYLANADVLTIHPSKNLMLNQKYEPVDILMELKKVKVDLRRHDIDIKNYRNGGETLQFYNSNSTVVFYDKIADLTKPMVRSIDRDKPKLMPGIMDQKILRYEVRLNDRKKINQVLSLIGGEQNIKLKDIFYSNICQEILIKYWNDFFGENNISHKAGGNPITELGIITKPINKIRIKESIYRLGLKYLLSNEDGYMGAIKTLSRQYKPSSVKVVKQDMDLLSNILPSTHNQFMADIETELARFKPVKKVRYYYGYGEQNEE